jgi:predicted permease
MLLPAFIFCEVVQNFQISQYHLILQSLLGCVTLYLVGLLAGYISAKVLKLNSNQTKFICGVFSSPHTTSIPLLLIEVTHPVLAKISKIVPADGIMDTRSRGMLYIVLNSIFANIWRWTVPYNLINKELSDKKVISELEVNLIINSNEKPQKANYPQKLTVGTFCKEIINMPIIASFLSLLLCLHPEIQSYFNSRDAFLNKTILSVNKIASKGYGFLVMFLLGLNFADLIFPLESSDENKKPKTVVFSSSSLAFLTFMKLIIMPIIASPIIIFLFIYNIITDDVMIFLFLFMAAAPNAINVIVVCSVKNAYVETVSMMMVIQYLVSLFTLTFEISLIIWFLSII